MFFCGPLQRDVPVLADQQELIYISFVWTLDAVWKTCWEQWMIGTNRERESQSGKFVASMCLDGDFLNTRIHILTNCYGNMFFVYHRPLCMLCTLNFRQKFYEKTP